MNWTLARRRQALHRRSLIIRAIRTFFTDAGFLEVETPLRIPAPAPELHIDAIPANGWFLQTSPELCMKRLLAAGHERIFQLARCWRAGERGSRHLDEFTMLEWYRASADYRDLMVDCQGLLLAVAEALETAGVVRYQGDELSLHGEWERLSVEEACTRLGGMTVDEALATDRFDEIMVERIEPRLGRTTPTFLYDYPAQLSALARLKPDNPAVAERFELYVAGLELANGFSELVDPAEQRQRFTAEEAARRQAGRQPYPSPEPFLTELTAMPPAAGIALGVDRLVMLFLDAVSIDDVVAFTPEDL